MDVQRFSFAGFVPVRQTDTPTHEVEVGKITQDDEVFIVHMIRRKGLPFVGRFLVAKVFQQNKCLWDFPRDSFQGLGFLTLADEEVVIALVGNGRQGKVEEIIPFSFLVKRRPLNLRRKIELKRLAAEYLGRGYNLTETECQIAKRDDQQRREDQRATREARRRLRMELINRIIKRGRIEAYTSDGGLRFGLPVVDEEWQSLANGTYVVRVKNYNDETGEAGVPIEAFRVMKGKGRNPAKGSPTYVWENRGNGRYAADAASNPQPVDMMIIETKDEAAFEVAIYETMDDIRQARVAGLNNGLYATAHDKKFGDRYEIFSVHARGIETLGFFTSLA